MCRHSEGCWNSVSDDQFGEQTAIKTGKGGLNSRTGAGEWIYSSPISVYISDAMRSITFYRLQSDHQQPTTKSGRHSRKISALNILKAG